MCPVRVARLRANASLPEVPAPLSSIETHKLIANGLGVSARISVITSLIAEGLKPCAPKEPRPPKCETVAVNRCVDRPPRGPWMIGYSIPRLEEIRVLFHWGDELMDGCFITTLYKRGAETVWPLPLLLLCDFEG